MKKIKKLMPVLLSFVFVVSTFTIYCNGGVDIGIPFHSSSSSNSKTASIGASNLYLHFGQI